MSLSTAISTAQTIFSNTGLQSAALAKNIANASNPDYARRVGSLTIDSSGAQQLTIERSYDNGLVKQTMYATADYEGQATLQEKLERIRSLLGGNDYETSPSTYIATLRDNLQAFATKPNESTLASTVVSSAVDVTNSLNGISSEIQAMRGTIDQEIGDLVRELNGYLKQFEVVNNAIKAGTATGTDINNELDMRERYVKQISEIIGIRTFTRGDNDMVIYTSAGTMLFDISPREISFIPVAAYDAGTPGKPIVVDGVQLEGGDSGNTTSKGKLQALLQVRDTVIPTYQKQLDETARGLIEVFAQTDQTDSGLPDIPGLFTYQDYDYDTEPGVPDSSAIIDGLSAQISVNTSLIKSVTEGGNPIYLRDGGFNIDGEIDAANLEPYKGNTNNDASYSDILDKLVAKFEEDISFHADTLLDVSTTLGDFTTGSVGWLEQMISESAVATDNKSAQLTRIAEALSNTTGVSLDEEMSLMLDLEQSFKASSKLVSAVDDMIQSLLSAIG
jgi:flagellar hook-associated protein 1 FlgK